MSVRLLPASFGQLDNSTLFEQGYDCQEEIVHQVKVEKSFLFLLLTFISKTKVLRFLDGEQYFAPDALSALLHGTKKQNFNKNVKPLVVVQVYMLVLLFCVKFTLILLYLVVVELQCIGKKLLWLIFSGKKKTS